MATQPNTNSFGVLFARLGWMAFGPIALLLILSTIAQPPASPIEPADLAYGFVVAGMIACRYVEFRTGQGLTATGEPMTKTTLTRYYLTIVAIGVVLWIGAKAKGLGAI